MSHLGLLSRPVAARSAGVGPEARRLESGPTGVRAFIGVGVPQGPVEG
ncbi:hypothetical protein [Streptomyces sp. NPDC056323]